MAGKLCFKKFLGFEFLVFNGLTMKAGHKITTQKYTKKHPIRHSACHSVL